MTSSRNRYGVLMLLVVGAFSLPIQAEAPDCAPGTTLEVVTYDWKLKGILSLIAGLRFPTKGSGSLATHRLADTIETELRIVSKDSKSEHYLYQSALDLSRGGRTIKSVDGYSFDDRVRTETATLDYDERKSTTVRKDTKHGNEISTWTVDLPEGDLRDVLTTIHYIRENASALAKKQQRASVFTAGKLYNVLITPGKTEQVEFGGNRLTVTVFTMSATPEDKKKWPGDVEVWITRDERHLPLRIILDKKMASLNLEATAVYNCP